MKEKIIYLHNKIIGLSSTKLIALMLMLKIIITIIVLPLMGVFADCNCSDIEYIIYLTNMKV